MKYIFQICTILLLIVSFILDKKKTYNGLKIAFKRFLSILPTFIIVILLTSVVLGFLPPATIQRFLGRASDRWIGTAVSAVFGSIAIMPGFVAFPLGAILRSNGVPYMVISAFTTTLMMVGIITFPIEKAFLGGRVALMRNIIGLIIALIVSIFTGLFFGEIFN